MKEPTAQWRLTSAPAILVRMKAHAMTTSDSTTAAANRASATSTVMPPGTQVSQHTDTPLGTQVTQPGTQVSQHTDTPLATQVTTLGTQVSQYTDTPLGTQVTPPTGQSVTDTPHRSVSDKHSTWYTGQSAYRHTTRHTGQSACRPATKYTDTSLGTQVSQHTDTPPVNINKLVLGVCRCQL